MGRVSFVFFLVFKDTDWPHMAVVIVVGEAVTPSLTSLWPSQQGTHVRHHEHDAAQHRLWNNNRIRQEISLKQHKSFVKWAPRKQLFYRHIRTSMDFDWLLNVIYIHTIYILYILYVYILILLSHKFECFIAYKRLHYSEKPKVLSICRVWVYWCDYL